MVLYALVLAGLTLLPHYDVAYISRPRRDASGALEIVTNNAEPIHADVKHEAQGTQITEKPRYSSWLSSQALFSRRKRDASGALHIVTNNAQPIHADVKPEVPGTQITEKPCPKNKNLPSHIESGVVFQVTPPQDTYFKVKSLRKSLGQLPSKLELVRNISRVLTLATLLVSAVMEFFPLLQNLYHMVYTFLYL